MKNTAIQEMMMAIEKNMPRLLNTSTSDGKKFIELVYPFFEMEKEQIKEAYQEGSLNLGFPESGEDYYNEKFNTKT